MNQQQVTENKQDHQLHSPSKVVKANEHAHKQDHPLMQAQNLIGNHGILQHFGFPIIQAKLKIGEPNDVYEQEADRVADEVMRMPDPQIQRKSPWNEDEEDDIQMKPITEQISPIVQRKGETEHRDEDDEDEPIQMKSSGEKKSQLSPKIESQIRSMQGGGEPLPTSVRDFFEPRFGADFSHVRIHSDPAAARTARSIHAEAFTTGHDIAFAEGRFQPGTREGNTLIAHELTHVVQQNNNQNKINKNDVQKTKIANKKNKNPNLSSEDLLKYELDKYGKDVLRELVQAQKDAIDRFHDLLKNKSENLTDFWSLIGASLGTVVAGAAPAAGGVSAAAAAPFVLVGGIIAAIGSLGVMQWTKSGVEKFLYESKRKCYSIVESHGNSYESTVTNLAISFGKDVSSGNVSKLTPSILNYNKIKEIFRQKILQAPSQDRVYDIYWNQLCDNWNNYLMNSIFWKRYTLSARKLIMERRNVRP